MSERGVFAVDRGIFDHPVLDERQPYTRREAWLWMLSEAAWKPCRKRVGQAIVEIKRGQFSHSVRFIGAAWGWSKSRVDRFLDDLRSETMIGTDSGTGQLLITICKYEDYQKVSLPSGTASEPLGGTVAGQERDRLESIKSIRKEKEDTNVSSKKSVKSELMVVLDEEHANAIIEYRRVAKPPLTARAAKMLASEFAKCPEPNAAADEMISRNWRGFKASWLTEHHRTNGNGKATNGSSLFELYRELNEEIAGYDDAERAGGDESGDRRDDDRLTHETGGGQDTGGVVPLRLSYKPH